MKQFLNVHLLILFISVNIHSQIKPDFSLDSLFVVQDDGNYLGKDDCSAMVSLFSDSNKINIIVTVVDDILTFSNDPLNSDHSEL